MKEAGMDRSLFINMYIYLQAVEDQESACERSRNRHCCLVNTVNVLALVADNWTQENAAIKEARVHIAVC